MNAIARAATGGDLQRLLNDIPEAWRPPILHLSAVVGGAWERMGGALLVRLRDYSFQGFTDDDIADACEAMLRPAVQAVCDYPDEYLAAFARCLENARAERVRKAALAKEAERRAEADKAVTPADRQKVHELIASFAGGARPSTRPRPRDTEANRQFLEQHRGK